MFSFDSQGLIDDVTYLLETFGIGDAASSGGGGLLMRLENLLESCVQ